MLKQTHLAVKYRIAYLAAFSPPLALRKALRHNKPTVASI